MGTPSFFQRGGAGWKDLFLVPWLTLAMMAGAEEVVISGTPVPGMESVDRAYSAFMKRHELPGGSVAVMKDGKLVYARGFGWADQVERCSVEPDTLFRIASISKPVTALLVVSLVEEGKLRFDQKVFPYLDMAAPSYPGARRDPRLDLITVEHLLHHAGGWDRKIAIDPDGKESFDPMFWTNRAAEDLTGKPYPPATAEQVIQWMIGKPLQFDPGSRSAYSNLGYCVLGRVIEKATGMDYETYAKSVLEKAGIRSMRIGRSGAEALLVKETRYYDYPGAGLRKSAWGEEAIPGPHRFALETLDAHGGWIATASDIVRFTTLFDERPEPADLIAPGSIERIYRRPDFAPSREDSRNFYGMGWSFFESEDGSFRNWFHSGSIPGTMAMLIRSDTGIVWAALFNRRPKESKAAFKDLDATMWKAVRGVETWPTP